MKRTARLHCQFPEIPKEGLARLAHHITASNEAAFGGLMSLLLETRECLALLDQPVFIQAVRKLRHELPEPLFCYVEVRQRLLKAGIQNQDLAVYLMNIWISYRESGILPDLTEPQNTVLESVDILRELPTVKGYEKFELLAMCGNYYLFLMAFFEGYFHDLDKLGGRSALAYYEAFARIAFRAARDHGLSEEFELWSVYDELSDRFQEVRTALSGLAG